MSIFQFYPRYIEQASQSGSSNILESLVYGVTVTMVDIVAFPSPISDKVEVINSQNFFSNEWARYASIAATGTAANPAVKAPAITVGL